ncbi:hypothetical protein Gocc_1564 [Gaiella occulta]|uniref:Uncharacterized protein n=1 Tax=Gaiella occulta TaxID=1002870 RepID=A0A7M2YXF3_9ACTN|nr:hypothetical protein [Gaiella occulta]RDI74675.1 hypothetical protein Gocc_1564 [Gaiella occulta]
MTSARGGRAALVLTDIALSLAAATGTVVFAHNETVPVTPASNEKLPVAWAAQDRFVTALAAAG